MELTLAKKIVIITEAIIEERVISLLNARGLKGYTVYRGLHGKGAHGKRSALGAMEEFGFGENVRIDAIVTDEEQAVSVMEAVYEDFLFERYAGIAYLEDVRVIRPEKF